MSTKTIDQLCARDLGKRVRITNSGGDTVEGALGHVLQYGRKEGRFALFSLHSTYEIRVGSFCIAGLSGRKEVEFR